MGGGSIPAGEMLSSRGFCPNHCPTGHQALPRLVLTP